MDMVDTNAVLNIHDLTASIQKGRDCHVKAEREEG